MQRLRPFFKDFHELINGYAAKNATGVWINGAPVSGFFSTVSHPPVLLDEGEDADSVCPPSVKSTSFKNMFFRLGLPDDLSFQQDGYKCELISDKYPIGFALHYRNIKFARHAVLEVGSDTHHVRIDIKDSHVGDLFPVQIDQIILWDKNNRHQIPLSPNYVDLNTMNFPRLWQAQQCKPCHDDDNYFLPYIEDIMGTIDLTIQALDSESDEQAYSAFSDIDRVLNELRSMLVPGEGQRHVHEGPITP
jgi:hypothetical protein